MSMSDPTLAQRELQASTQEQVDRLRAQEVGLTLDDYRDTQLAGISGLTLAQYRAYRTIQATGRPVTLADYYAIHGRDANGRIVSARNDSR